MNSTVMQLGVVITLRDLLSRGMGKAAQAVKGLDGNLKDLVASGMKWVKTGAMIATVGAVMLGALAPPTMAAARFEHRMAEVSTMVDTTAVSMARLKSETMELSQRFGQDMDAMGQAMYNVFSAGVDPAKSYDTLALASKAAIAGVTDVNTAATVGVNVMNAYKMPVSELARIYDVLFMTVKSGVTTFPELAQYLGEVTSIASTAHIPIEQLGAAIAGLTAAGIKTPQAMTAVRGLIQSVAAPTKHNREAIEQLGGAELQAAVRTGNLVKMLEILGAKTNSLADIRELVPNIEGAKGLAALTNNMDKFRATVQLTMNSAGALDQAFQKMEQSPMHKWNQLKSSMKVLKVTIGSQLIPAFKGMLANLTPIVQGITDWMKRHPKLTRVILKSVAALGALLTVLGTLVVTVGAFKLAAAFLPKILISTATSLATAAKAAWGFTVALLSNPITWVIAGVVALGVGLYFLVTRWDQVKAAVKSATTSMKEHLQKVPDWVLSIIPGVGQVLLAFKHWDQIGPIVKSALSAIPGIFDKAISWIMNRGIDIQRAIMKPINWIRKKVGMDPLTLPVHVKPGDIKAARQDLVSMWKEGAAIIKKNAQAAGEGAKNAFGAAKDGLKDLVSGTNQALTQLGGGQGGKQVTPAKNWRQLARKIEQMGRGAIVQKAVQIARPMTMERQEKVTLSKVDRMESRSVSEKVLERLTPREQKAAGNITIHVNGAQDPEAAAREVVRQIQLAAEMG